MKLDVVVPIEVISKVNASHGMNMGFKAARVKEDKNAVIKALMTSLITPTLGGHSMRDCLRTFENDGARVTLLRPYVTAPLDDDNLANAFKDTRDAVAAFLGLDDGSPRYHWRCAQVKAKNIGKRMNKAKTKKVKDKETGVVTKVRTTPKMVPAYDTHIRIRIEIVPADQVDPLLTAVRVLREQLIVALSSTNLTIKHSGIDIEGVLQVPRDFIRNTTGAIQQADALAFFDPKELYNV